MINVHYIELKQVVVWVFNLFKFKFCLYLKGSKTLYITAKLWTLLKNFDANTKNVKNLLFFKMLPLYLQCV